jgi:hypothetical protein
MFYLYSLPLLSPADVVAYTVRTGCHPTLYLLQGLELHAGLTIPYPGIRSLIGDLSATLPLPPLPPQIRCPHVIVLKLKLEFRIATSCPLDVVS